MKKCRACKVKFEPFNSLQVACSLECAQEVAIKELERRDARRDKAQRKWVREQKERIKSRGDHTRDTQRDFNTFIRSRDEGKPCISCGRNEWEFNHSSRGGMWDCGHYRSVGACPELRFEPLNAARQCKSCNRDKSGNIVEYRISLRERIGDEALAWLEGPHDPKRYTVEDLKRMAAEFRACTRELQKQREAA